MLLEIKRIPSKRPKRWQERTIYVLKCDQCGATYERGYCSQGIKTAMHFCTRECKRLSQSSGLFAQKVANPWTREDVKAKIKKVINERYGVDSPMQRPEILSKVMRSRRHASVRTHWKTGASLTCVGSYESAFVDWCNENKIDFDWQIGHRMPDGRTYIVDAFIKDGTHAGTWVEIKGWMSSTSKQKWEWFHSQNHSSELWTKNVLVGLGIITRRKEA